MASRQSEIGAHDACSTDDVITAARRSSAAQPPSPNAVPAPLIDELTPPTVLEACIPAVSKVGGGALSQLGVTSAVRGEGRTSIARAIAIAQARLYGRPTLLVDADFDDPRLVIKLPPLARAGLAEVLRGEIGLDAALQPAGGTLTVLGAGMHIDEPWALAGELMTSAIFEDLARRFASVIVDLPALVASSCGPVLASAFRQVLLVIRAGVTSRTAVQEALSLLETQPMVLLNGVHARPGWGHGLVDN